MRYIVRLTYIDEKTIDLDLEEKEVPVFMESLKKSDPYWGEDKAQAFWTADSQVRFARIFKKPDDYGQPREKAETSDNGDEGIQPESSESSDKAE